MIIVNFLQYLDFRNNMEIRNAQYEFLYLIFTEKSKNNNDVIFSVVSIKYTHSLKSEEYHLYWYVVRHLTFIKNIATFNDIQILFSPSWN